LCFERDGWTCVDCGWLPQCVRDCRAIGIEDPPTDIILDELRRAKLRGQRHLHGEHERTIEERPDLRSDLDNYRTRCNVCHAAKTMRELRRGAANDIAPASGSEDGVGGSNL
jgi:hypothetical protein